MRTFDVVFVQPERLVNEFYILPSIVWRWFINRDKGNGKVVLFRWMLWQVGVGLIITKFIAGDKHE